MKILSIGILAVLLWLILFNPGSTCALELVENGGFETGDLTGWSLFGGTENDFGFSGVGSFSPNSGDHGFYSGAYENGIYLEQAINTTAGQDYTLGFWMSRDEQLNPFDEPVDSFLVFWGGDYWNPVFELQDFYEQDYSFYSIFLLATGAESLLSFYFFDSQSFINLDDVSVTAADSRASVPEPGTLALMATGLAGLAGGLRRNKSRI